MKKSNEEVKRENIAAYFENAGSMLTGLAILLLLLGGILAYWGGGIWKNIGYEFLAFAIVYFIGIALSKIPVCIFGSIIILVGAGIAYGTPNMLLGCIAAVLGLMLIVGKFLSVKSTTDEEMDKYINEDMQQIESNAIKMLDFEEEALLTKPIVLTSTPDFLDVKTSGSNMKAKIGADEIIRFSPINVTILYPCQKMVATYQATWDLLTGKALNENTDEYFYRDITSVSMKAESTQLQKSDVERIKDDSEITKKIKEELLKRIKKLPNTFDKLVISGQQMMVMSTAGGDKTSVFLKNDEIAEIAGFKTRDIGEMEKGIQNLRKLIREKKSE